MNFVAEKAIDVKSDVRHRRRGFLAGRGLARAHQRETNQTNTTNMIKTLFAACALAAAMTLTACQTTAPASSCCGKDGKCCKSEKACCGKGGKCCKTGHSH
jgi:hypothetical protein